MDESSTYAPASCKIYGEYKAAAATFLNDCTVFKLSLVEGRWQMFPSRACG